MLLWIRRCGVVIAIAAMSGVALTSPAAIASTARVTAVTPLRTAAAEQHRPPVLGARHVFVRGSGVAHPRLIDVAGIEGSVVDRISWRYWGHATAFGRGKKYQYKPGGGYYKRQVHVQLRAIDLGRCTPGGRLTYRRLRARVQHKPGGRFGTWFNFGGNNLCK